LLLVGHPSSCVNALSTTTPPSRVSLGVSSATPAASQVVTTVTPHKKKTLHFRKDKSSRRKGDRSSKWRQAIEQDIRSHKTVGTLSKELIDQIPPVITGWARRKSSEGAEKAQFLLERYVQEFKAGNPHALPETRLFNIAMDAWTKSRQRDSPQKIQAIMKMMQDLRHGEDTANSAAHLIPDVISMSSLCLAWAKSRQPHAADQAQAILEYMERQGLRPNTITYNAVLLAYAKSTRRDKALQVERIIDQMSDRSKVRFPECRPDVCSYQSLICAWSRTALSGTPQKAEEVLHFLDTESRVWGKKHLTPNAHCYVAAIHAWSHSEEQHKSRRAYEILQHMRLLYDDTKDEHVKPNVFAYTAVLNACALPVCKSERADALQIAMLVMDELRLYKHDAPNFLTYAAFLHVVGSTLAHDDERRDTLASTAIERAQADGQVGYIVLEKLHIASPNTYRAIVKDITEEQGALEVVRIPHPWGRHVVGERDPSRRVLKDDAKWELQKSSYLKLQEVKRKHGKKSSFFGSMDRRKNGIPVDEGFTIEWSEESLR
jgi:hypothetical protein